MKLRFATFALAALLSPAAHAALMNGPAFANLALPPQMFSVAQDGTVNPSFTFTSVPGYGTLTVSYGRYFVGQSASSFFSPPTDVSGAPSSPLTLSTTFDTTGTDDTSYKTVIEPDLANVQEVLAGVPAPATNGFGGPVAILFSAPVDGVTLTAGSFDLAGSATIQAFTASGTSLGTVANTQTGNQTFNLSDSNGMLLSGLLITSTDPAGFSITGVGIEAAAPVTGVPAPGSTALLPALLILARRARKRG